MVVKKKNISEAKTKFLRKIEAFSRRSKLTILLDENIECLCAGLEDAGFKVITIEKGWSDEKIKKIAEGTAILTRNAIDFENDAVVYDYDIISIESIKFIDKKPFRSNVTVRKIEKVIRESKFYNVRGNFKITIQDNGSYDVEPLA